MEEEEEREERRRTASDDWRTLTIWYIWMTVFLFLEY